ncbi:uncharacterized protein LOC131851336 [Achroia grisella]|uniref:uncharacterized protein LOC131851336 n=1 Tax=Achroia grisella TaxID=688607 RepID=UPI0027D2CFC1|nr:uncharacterized protein LOC131851336 [Achroia grisella]
MAGGVQGAIVIIGLLFYSVQEAKELRGTRIQYFSTEHPRILYYDRNIVEYANLTSRRVSRKDPFYYVDFNARTLTSLGNNVTVNFYFFEFLTNVYKRGFIEMHFRGCDFINKDSFFAGALRRQANSSILAQCPYPKGNYHFHNMSIPLSQVPRGFPFTKGRIYCNLTITDTDIVFGSGYIDLELKTTRISN